MTLSMRTPATFTGSTRAGRKIGKGNTMHSSNRRNFMRLMLAAAATCLSVSLFAGSGARAEDIAAAPEVAAMLPQSVRDAGVLRVAMPDTGRPLAYKEGSELKGLDPDLARALAAVLGLKPQLELIPFASALT